MTVAQFIYFLEQLPQNEGVKIAMTSYWRAEYEKLYTTLEHVMPNVAKPDLFKEAQDMLHHAREVLKNAG